MDWYNKTLCVAAAGTGGHIFPALAVAQKAQKHGAKIVWIGTAAGMENDLLSQAVKSPQFELRHIQFVGFFGKSLSRWLLLPWYLIRAIFQARKILKNQSQVVVLAMGGYVSVPVVLAAYGLKIPIVVHEQNAYAGMANRLNVRFATIICVAFSSAFPASKKRHLTGNPLRQSIVAKAPSDSSEPDVPTQFDAHRPLRLLVFGGSLGATKFNEVVPACLWRLQSEGYDVDCQIQCGKNRAKAVQQKMQQLGVRAQAHDFIEDMPSLYQWSDLVVCRSGALTISELIVMKKPAILIPLPKATHDHQTLNANHMSKQGGAWMLKQNVLSDAALADKIKDIYQDPTLLAKATFEPQADATEKVLALCGKTLQRQCT